MPLASYVRFGTATPTRSPVLMGKEAVHCSHAERPLHGLRRRRGVRRKRCCRPRREVWGEPPPFTGTRMAICIAPRNMSISIPLTESLAPPDAPAVLDVEGSDP
jgi:hypothetical protein